MARKFKIISVIANIILLINCTNCLVIEIKKDNFTILVTNEENNIVGDPVPSNGPITGVAEKSMNQEGRPRYEPAVQVKLIVDTNAAKRFGDLYMFTIFGEIGTRLIRFDLMMVEYFIPESIKVIPYCNILPIESKPSEFDDGVDFIYDTYNATHIFHNYPVGMSVSLDKLELPIGEFIGTPFPIIGIEYNEIYWQFKSLTKVKQPETLRPLEDVEFSKRIFAI